MSDAASPVWTPVPLPEQVPVKEGIAKLPGTSLWYWDTEGKGDVVVLLHAASGSGAFWGYQQPVLVKAGYRVISYSRRGHLKSDPGNQDDPGSASEDLQISFDKAFIDLLLHRLMHTTEQLRKVSADAIVIGES